MSRNQKPHHWIVSLLLIDLTPRYTIHVPISLSINTAVDPSSLDSPVGVCQVLINHIVAKQEKPATLTLLERFYGHVSSSSSSSSSSLVLFPESEGYVPHGTVAYRLLKKLVAIFTPSTQLLFVRILIRHCPYSNLRPKTIDFRKPLLAGVETV
jgi:hypothetical protein